MRGRRWIDQHVLEARDEVIVEMLDWLSQRIDSHAAMQPKAKTDSLKRKIGHYIDAYLRVKNYLEALRGRPLVDEDVTRRQSSQEIEAVLDEA